MQPRPSHPRTITHSPLRPYAQRPVRQFTPLSMTLTRAFEKFRDGGLIVPLASRPLPYPHRLHYLWTYTRAYPFRPSLLASSFQLTFGFGSLDRIFHPVSLSFRVGTTPISIGHCLISQSLGLHLYRSTISLSCQFSFWDRTYINRSFVVSILVFGASPISIDHFLVMSIQFLGPHLY